VKPLPQRWLLQAEADLSAARDSERSSHYEWACFQAQQSAEKALKSLLFIQGRTAVITHSIADLVEEARAFAPDFGTLADEAKYLDTFYLATRYPNALAGERPPSQYYGQGDAQRCLLSAESILAAVKRYIESSSAS